MKKINLRDYYPYYTQDMIVEVPDEVALLLREYMLLEEAYRIRTYRYLYRQRSDRDKFFTALDFSKCYLILKQATLTV